MRWRSWIDWLKDREVRGDLWLPSPAEGYSWGEGDWIALHSDLEVPILFSELAWHMTALSLGAWDTLSL